MIPGMAAGARAPTILIVEDEAVVALDLLEQIQEMGYAVCGTVNNGAEAITAAWRWRPSLVLMDIVIKGPIDGIEAATDIGRGLHIPVVFLTAYSDLDTVERAALSAPYGYLTKPFQPDELRAAIEIALFKSAMERRLHDSERWFASTLRCVADGIVATDGLGKVRFMNAAAESMLGWPLAEALGRDAAEVAPLAPPRSAGIVESPIGRALAHGGVIGTEHGSLLCTRTGERIPVDDAATRILSDEGELVGAVMLFRDVRERIEEEEKLKRSEQYFRNVFDFAPVGMALMGLDNRFLRVNGALCALLGYAEAELVGQCQQRYACADEPGAEAAIVKEILEGDSLSSQFEKRYRHRDGGTVHGLVSVSMLRQRGAPLCYLWQVHDLTERKNIEARLARLAHFDPLTGLANRAALSDEIARQVLQARRHGTRLAVMFADLDHFKQVNDSLGHEAGDELLKSVARTLKSAVRAVDMVARLGGDEFVLLLPELSGPEDVLAVSAKVRGLCAEPVRLAGHDISVGISIGVSMFPDDADDPGTLLRFADSALYHAKAEGRGNLQFYRPELMARVQLRMALGAGLRLAMERHEFALHFQPIIAMSDGHTVMAEALIRWNHPERGLVLPGVFFGLAEEIGMSDAIGAWVLRRACRAAAGWPDHAGGPIVVAVNVSPFQFRGGKLVPTVRAALTESGLAPDRLCVEITEQVLLERCAENLAAIKQLKDLGVRIAIDNFGAGYASLGYLSRFSPTEIKIDGSLLKEVASKPLDAALVKTTIVMAHSLNLSVVTEGVETRAQRDFLNGAGSDMAQGFLFARPVPEAAFAVWLM